MNTAVISPVNVPERHDLDLRPGDTVRVHQKIEDKGKTRLQVFEGTVLARKHGREAGATFTVRRTTGGYGVEKIFPLYSPMIDKIEIIKRAKVRRAKLYYIREKAAREIKRQMRRLTMMYSSTEGETERADREAKEAEAAEATPETPPETDTPTEAEAPAEETTTEEAPVEEAKEETPAEEPKEEAPAAEEKAEPAPVEEAAVEAESENK